MEIDIWVDGGALNNQNADKRQAYGSFALFSNGKQQEMTLDRGTRNERKTKQARLQFGNQSNNYAEWATMVVALTYAWQLQSHANKAITIRIHGDSDNVLKAMTGEYGVKAPHLIPLYEQAKSLAHHMTIEWYKEPESLVKKVLGH